MAHIYVWYIPKDKYTAYTYVPTTGVHTMNM